MFPGKWVAMRERGEGQRKDKVDDLIEEKRNRIEGKNGKVER